MSDNKDENITEIITWADANVGMPGGVSTQYSMIAIALLLQQVVIELRKLQEGK